MKTRSLKLRSACAMIVATLLVTQPVLASQAASRDGRGIAVTPSEAIQSQHHIDNYRIEIVDQNRSLIHAYREGQRVARFEVRQDHESIALALEHDGNTWTAKAGMSFMHETQEGMFGTSTFNLSRKSANGEEDSFVFVSDLLGDTQLNVTYVLNGQTFRKSVDNVTPADEAAFLEILNDSGANRVFENEETALAYAILGDQNINEHLPRGLRGLGSTFAKDGDHTVFSTVTNCALAAACMVFVWGGGLACVGCAVVSFSCGWGLAELADEMF